MSTTQHLDDHCAKGAEVGPARFPGTPAGPGRGAARTGRGLRRAAPVPTDRTARRLGHAATVAVSAAFVAAVAAATLSGCGIRSTAVPVDAGIPASRTACPPTPGATTPPGAAGEGPAVLTTTGPSDLIGPTDLPSQTPWEALDSALPLLPESAPSGTATASGAGAARASHGSAAARGGTPTPAERSTRAPAGGAATAAPAAGSTSGTTSGSSSGFSLDRCPGASATGAP